METTDHEVLRALAEHSDQLREQEAGSIERRSLSPETAALLRELSVIKLVQPKRFGGLEADPCVFNEALAMLGRHSSAAGWVAGVVGVHAWHLGLYSEQAQQEVWGEDPDVWISSSYGPAGQYRRVPGGFELTGRWGFSSGSDHCDWVFVGGLSTDDETPVYRHFLLPRPDYTVDQVWNASGLLGTGSHDIVVDGAFVPDHRTMVVDDLIAGEYPGTEVNTSALFRMPWNSFFINAVVMPLVGMARAAVDEARASHQQRLARPGVALPGGMTLASLARADAEVDTARTILQANLAEIYRTVCDRRTATVEQRMRVKRDHVFAVLLAVAAADRAYASGGPRSIMADGRLQQVWRDVHAGQHHAVNSPDTTFPGYGTFFLTGEPSNPY